MKSVSIYVLFDENGPRYVGKTVSVATREREHFKDKEWLVQLLVIEVVSPEDRWQDRERFWIAYYSQWYKLENKYPGGNGPSIGHKLSEQTKQKIGAANKIALKGRVPLHFKGIKHSPEHTAKLPQNQPGVKWSPEAIKARADANRGKKRSLETRLKISRANTGKYRNPKGK